MKLTYTPPFTDHCCVQEESKLMAESPQMSPKNDNQFTDALTDNDITLPLDVNEENDGTDDFVEVW